MKESYTIVDKRVTPCTEPSGYQQDKEGELNSFVNAQYVEPKKLDM